MPVFVTDICTCNHIIKALFAPGKTDHNEPDIQYKCREYFGNPPDSCSAKRDPPVFGIGDYKTECPFSDCRLFR